MGPGRLTSVAVAAFLLAAVLACGRAGGQGQGPEKAAVLDFEAQGGVPARTTRILSDALREHFTRTKQYDIMTREEMEPVLRKGGFRLSDCTSNESILAAGRALGVRRLFAGSVGKDGDAYYVSLTLYSTDTGDIEPIGIDACPLCPEGALIDSLERLAARVAAEDRTTAETRTAPAERTPGKTAP